MSNNIKLMINNKKGKTLLGTYFLNRILILFWVLYALSPIFTTFSPKMSSTCLTCQASNHAICHMSGHDCSHQHPHSIKELNQENDFHRGDQKFGHQCSQSGAILFTGMDMSYLPLSELFLLAGITHNRFKFNVAMNKRSVLEHTIDHPPNSLLIV